MTHGSLFSGIGGFELGAERAGIETLWACEIEEFQRKVLQKHFPNTRIYNDIRELTKPEYVDIISGGFPCQDISISNTKAKGIKGERSGLWSEMFRICGEIRPKYIIIENSPMLLRRGFEQVLCDLSEIGYNAEWQVLQADEFGFPHRRKRIYCVAYSNEIGFNVPMYEQIQLFKPLSEREAGQIKLPMPVKRINAKSDFESLRMYDGFSRELDKNSIATYGNAVIPKITEYIFNCIIDYDKGYGL